MENENENNPDLDKLLHNIDGNNGSTKEDAKPDQSIDTMLYGFVEVIASMTTIVSEHTGLKSVALTEADKKTLIEGLKPLSKYISSMLNYIIYMPLIIFSIGYTLRILKEMKDKKKVKNEKTDDGNIKIERE
jgi:hypothetical protein